MLGDFLALLRRDGKSARDSKVTPENFAEMVKMVEKGEISTAAAKTVIVEMYATGGDPSDIVDTRNLRQVSDKNAIAQACEKVIAANPEVVEKYKGGKTSVIGVLVGEVMKEMKGAANPKVINEILRDKLA